VLRTRDAIFYVFDLLWRYDADLRGLPPTHLGWVAVVESKQAAEANKRMHEREKPAKPNRERDGPSKTKTGLIKS
jgi:hypothetical protein